MALVCSVYNHVFPTVTDIILQCDLTDSVTCWQNASSTTPPIDPTTHIRFFFTLQSSKLTFTEWIWLLTLAFAPLLAHLFVGGPQIVILGSNRARWLDVMCLYNPTTIIWRYYSIAVRRTTYRKWTPYDAAVANVAFWTDRSWDGSLNIAKEARPSCTKVGTRSRIRVISKSAAQSVIVALQGAQTVTDSAQGRQNGDGGEEISVCTIFTFISVIGLLRLLVAPWLVDDFSFADYDEDRMLVPSKAVDVKREDGPVTPKTSRTPEHPRGWRVWAIRACFVVPLTAHFTLTLLLLVPFKGKGLIYTATCLALIVFMTYLASATLCIMIWSMYHEQDTCVVLPVVNSAWYKVYTLSVYAGLLVLLLLSCLETRRTFCGVYTTFPKHLDLDVWICKKISYI